MAMTSHYGPGTVTGPIVVNDGDEADFNNATLTSASTDNGVEGLGTVTVKLVGSTITSGDRGITDDAAGTLTVTLDSGSSIAGGTDGIGSVDAVIALTNAGMIQSTNTSDNGVYLGVAGSTVVNSGTISGGSGAYAIDANATSTITNSGMLTAGASGALEFGTGGGTLNLSDGTTAGTITGGIVDNGPLTISNNGVATYTLMSAVSGAGSLQKIGAGTLTLSATNTYSGGTTVTGGGTLVVTHGDSDNYVDDLGSGAVTLDGGTLAFGAGSGAGVRGGNVIVVGASGGTLNTVDTTAGEVSLHGLSGSGALTVVASSADPLFLNSDDSAFTGTVSVTQGVLKTEATNALTAANAVSLASGTTLDLFRFSQAVGALSGAGGVTNTFRPATLTVGGLETNTTFSGAISDGATEDNITPTVSLTKVGVGVLTLTGADTYTGGTTISAGTLQIGAAGGTTGSIAGNVVDNATLEFSRSDATTFAGVISGTGVVVVDGGGVLTVSGANTYTGGTTVTGGATVIANHTVTNDGTSDALGGAVTLNNGTLAESDGGAIVNAVVVGSGGGALNGSSGNIYITGAISGAGPLATSGGVLLYGDDSGYSGALTVAGALVAGSSNALSPSSAVSLANNANLTLLSSQTIASLSGAGVVRGEGSGPVTSLTAGGSGASTVFSGVLQDASSMLALTKTGAGVFTLTGANTYTGGTTIDAGVVELAGATVGAHGAITSGSAGAGAITFGAMGTETLRVDAAAATGTDFAYDVDGFAIGQGVINLHDAATATHAAFNAATGVLSVEDASNTVVATLHLGGSFTGDAFAVMTDAAGGVDVTVESAPPPPPPPTGGGGGGEPAPDATYIGTPGSDLHVGGTGTDLEYGEGGSDTLTGSQGADTIYAGSGPSGAGANAGDVVYLFGGQGDDVLTGGSQGHDAIFGNLGNDHITTLGSAVSSVYGGQGDDVIDDRAANNFNYLSGDLGNDTIYAGAGFDTVLGGQGDDVIVGSTTAGAGSLQLLFGNQGNDHLSYAAAGSVEMFGGQDNDVLTVTTSGQGQVHDLFGNLGDDTLTASGGYNSLYGGQGDDVVSAANDTVGHNYLSGDLGNDTIIGSQAGGDTLHGGQGADVIMLGTHAAGDRIVISGVLESESNSPTDETNVQHITGFLSGSDHVVLAGHAALAVGAGGNLTTFVDTTAQSSEAAAFQAAYAYAYGAGVGTIAHAAASEYLAVQETYGATTATYIFTADHHAIALVGQTAGALQSGDVLAG